jgi:anti-sigma regulatory factor (Ser/Thr protein kinase)
MTTPHGDAGEEDEWSSEPLLLTNDLSEVARASRWLDGQLEARGVGPAVAFRLDLLLAESLTNSISYAFLDGIRHGISVGLHGRGQTIYLRVEDDGQPFNPLEVPAHVQPKDLDAATVGGLGVHLIRSYTDQCEYRREGGRNVLTMTIRNPHSKADPAPEASAS